MGGGRLRWVVHEMTFSAGEAIPAGSGRRQKEERLAARAEAVRPGRVDRKSGVVVARGRQRVGKRMRWKSGQREGLREWKAANSSGWVA